MSSAHCSCTHGRRTAALAAVGRAEWAGRPVSPPLQLLPRRCNERDAGCDASVTGHQPQHQGPPPAVVVVVRRSPAGAKLPVLDATKSGHRKNASFTTPPATRNTVKSMVAKLHKGHQHTECQSIAHSDCSLTRQLHKRSPSSVLEHSVVTIGFGMGCTHL